MASTSRRQRTQGLLITLALLAATAHADVQNSFFWGFQTFTHTSLPECDRLQIYLNTSGMATAAQPPYTLIAYEPAGIPTRQLLGSDLKNLVWTVDHAAGAQLVLAMVDAAGNTGGIGSDIYNVIPSSFGTACHSSNPTSPVSITTNTTKVIKTCDVLPLKISGGTKPYTISVTTIGSTSVMNFTLDAVFDTYNWVNRAVPNTQIIASVSDAQGIYAPSTNLLKTTGSNDLTCGSRPSTEIDSTGQASAVQPGASAATQTSGSNSNASKKSTSTTTIIAAAVGGAVLIGALVIGALFCMRRRQRRKVNANRPRSYIEDPYSGFGLGNVGGTPMGQNVAYPSEEATPFVNPGGQIANPYTDNPSYQYSTYSSNYSSATSEANLGPTMQARPSTYNMASNIPPAALAEANLGPTMHSRTSTYTMASSIPPAFADANLGSTMQGGTSTYSVASSIPPAALAYAAQRNIGPSVVIPPSSGSVSSYDPYSVVPSSPSEKTGTSISKRFAGAASGTYTGSVSESEARTGVAGPSTARFAVSNPSPLPDPLDEKKEPVPAQTRQESIYQHEDILDVVELPPAYKERTDL